jgi:hypothetical protein
MNVSISAIVSADLHAVPQLEQMRTQRRASAVSFEPNWNWERFLDRLPEDAPQVTIGHVASVRSFWRQLTAALRGVPLPVTHPSSSGGVLLGWSTDRYTVEVDVFQGGEIDWFFRDRRTESLDGTAGEPVRGLPKKLVERLRLIVR